MTVVMLWWEFSWRMTVRGKNSASWANREVYLFGRPGEAAIKSTRKLRPAPVQEIPEPLPLDRPVCLQEVREISDQGDRVQFAANAGLLSSAAHPWATWALMVAPRTVGICTIPLMCKVDPDKGVPGK